MLEYSEIKKLFGGFKKEWTLPKEKIEFIEQKFQQKGNVLVQYDNIWYGAEDWKKRELYVGVYEPCRKKRSTR